MSTQSTAAPVRTSIAVEAPRQRAFEVFTQEMASWWPEDHHLLDGRDRRDDLRAARRRAGL